MNGKLRRINRILKKVNALAPVMAAKSDKELRQMTKKLKADLEAGKTLQEILPEAYAAIREAAKRVLGLYAYDVQVMGAIALSENNIAEMKTGEGKTLVAVMPLYLHALTGKSTILVTTNDYLAIRDGKQMKPLYAFMGLRLAIGVPEDPREQFTPENKKRIYAADIVYTTNGVLCFDYLIENLSTSKKDLYFRPYYYVIVDEADSVLFDAATMPLIISGAPRVQSNLYGVADYFVSTLTEADYDTEDMNVWLTPKGAKKAERFFAIPDLYEKENFELFRHIMLALRAHVMFERDRQYVVENNAVSLVDEASGRILPMTKMEAGMHQALEAKESVPVTRETRAMASITFQSFFRLFPKLAGMTGTAITEKDEFAESYGLSVIQIPTNRPVQRKDYPNEIFSTRKAQFEASLKEIKELHEKGQPILIITTGIELSDAYSSMLLREGIPHNKLNAYNIPKEADIIKEAGQRGAVTVATTVAGRGTDIRLGEGIREMGGLAVIGVGLMANRRFELQSRGRSGRQGDPGFSRFYVSLEDTVVDEDGPEWLRKYREKHPDKHLTSFRIRHAIKNIQNISADNERSGREQTMRFDESVKMQREVVYQMRRKLLSMVDTDPKYYLTLQKEMLTPWLKAHEDKSGKISSEDVGRYVLDHVSYRSAAFSEKDLSEKEATLFVEKLSEEVLRDKFRIMQEKNRLQNFLRRMTLRALDDLWTEQVDYLQQLRATVSGRQYAQRNIIYEYHKTAYRSFEKMRKRVKEEMLRNIFIGEIEEKPDGDVQILLP